MTTTASAAGPWLVQYGQGRTNLHLKPQLKNLVFNVLIFGFSLRTKKKIILAVSIKILFYFMIAYDF